MLSYTDNPIEEYNQSMQETLDTLYVIHTLRSAIAEARQLTKSMEQRLDSMLKTLETLDKRFTDLEADAEWQDEDVFDYAECSDSIQEKYEDL